MGHPDDLTILQASVALPDPQVVSDARDGLNLLAAVYDPLVRATGPERFGPALATDWTVTPDARTWTFHLRPDARCHDGSTLVAADVVASFDRARDPALGGSYGTDGVFRGYVADARIAAPDDRTVRISTAAPFASLLDLLVALPIVPRGALDRLAERPVGSGPFRVVDADDAAVTMAAFDDGWHGPPAARRLRWEAEPNHERRVERVLAGAADLATKVTPAGLRRLRAVDDARAVTAPNTTCVIFLCNLSAGPCTDARVRRAINHAVRVPRPIADLFGGAAERLRGPFTASHLAHDPASRPYAHDPARARQLLAAAGHAGGLALTIDIPTVMPDEARDLARLVADDLAAVGVRATVREHADRVAYAYMVRDKQIGDLALFDSSPASTYRVLREKFHGGVRGPWWQGYQNAAVDRLIDASQAATDDADRAAIFRRTTALIRDDAPWLFLYAPHLAWAVGPRLAGWQPGPDGIVRFG